MENLVHLATSWIEGYAALIQHLIEAGCAVFIVWSIWAYLQSPLREYPGPFLARWTNLWRLYIVWRKDAHRVVHRLHQKHGPVVRIGPNMLDIDEPSLIKTFYNTKGDYIKTEFYTNASPIVDGKTVANLFTTPSDQRHTQIKRPVAPLFTMNAVLGFEPYMDQIINRLCCELDERFVKTASPCDLGLWIHLYVWDAIGNMTFHQPYGYLSSGRDLDGSLAAMRKGNEYFALVGQMPFLDKFLAKNPIFPIGPPSLQPLIDLAAKRVIDRQHARGGGDGDGVDRESDFLDKLIEVKSDHSDVVDDKMVVNYLTINTIAGTDTTTAAIRSVIYYSLKHPSVWKRLKEEIRSSRTANNTKDTPVPFREARDMPYLEAVVRESMRMCPPIALPLERYTPPEGLHLPDGRRVPAGVKVGINPYVMARNCEIWGDDADEFRPGRWLRDGTEELHVYRERLTRMHGADLIFGAGSRICIGLNVAYLQIYKVAATLVERYDLELVDPEREWRVLNSWMVRQEGLVVRLVRRS